RWLGYLLNGQLQGKLLSAYKISQAFPGTPYMKDPPRRICATRESPLHNDITLSCWPVIGSAASSGSLRSKSY
ncbi:MAG: hypothetical protein ABSH01_26705, partial [Terriglobia bacterium]